MSTLVLAANDGGHLAQLRALAPTIPIEGEPLWVTVPTAQSRSMLADERVQWVSPAPTRDWQAAIRNGLAVRRLFEQEDVVAAVSTGSSLALSTLPWAARHRIPAHYIESVTRVDSFSVTGRLLRRTPGVSTHTQWPHMVGRGWTYAGSVLEGFKPTARPETSIHSLVVSLGTSATFGFRRLLERLVAVIPPGVSVTWQTGSTDTSGLEIEARPSIPERELIGLIREADAVVAHAGAGIALTILEAGKVPILVPRTAGAGEHIDDHQEQIAGRLADAGLAVVTTVDSLDWSLIERGATRAVERSGTPPMLRLT